MSRRQTLAYVLRHAWLWPLQFWLRPLDVSERARQKGQADAEIWCALCGSALWGAMLGTGVWLWNGETQAIWQLALAFVVVGTFAVAGSAGVADGDVPRVVVDIVCAAIIVVIVVIVGAVVGAVTEALAEAVAAAKVAADGFKGFFATVLGVVFLGVFGAIGGAAIGAITGAITSASVAAVAFVGVFAGSIAASITGSGAFAGSIALHTVIAFIGIMSMLLLPSMLTLVSAIAAASLLYLHVLKIIKTNKANVNALLSIALKLTSSLMLPCIAFTFVLTTHSDQLFNFAIVLEFCIASGIITGFYYTGNNPLDAVKQFNLKPMTQAANNLLLLFYFSFGFFAFAAWLFGQTTPGLKAKLDTLALFFALVAPIATGLPFWPLLGLMASWRFRSGRVHCHTQAKFATSLPFRWQTFAYPLPGLRKYLAQLYRRQDPDCAFQAIQATQLRSLQMRAARLAAWDLAAAPDTALGFCGHVALTCNRATLVPLAVTGPLARAVVVLAKQQNKETGLPLQLYVADYPPQPKLKFRGFGLPETAVPDWHEEFARVRADRLSVRVTYAMRVLPNPLPGTYGREFSQLLQILSAYAATGFRHVQNLPAVKKSREGWHSPWLMQGWGVMEHIETLLKPLEVYRELTTPSARRQLLESKAAELQTYTWKGVSEYWAAIGRELLTLWRIKLLEEVILAREWLRLEAQLNSDRLTLGVQTLQLQVRNPTGVLARNLRFQVEPGEGLDWHHHEAKQPLLEGGTAALIRLELEAGHTGSFRVAGQLLAEDVSGNAYSLPLAFQVHVAQAGRPYRLLDYQPYVVGEGLGDERTFVGRHELLHWLRGLWLQPQGKPAVVLVGQRRMGKTSLLNKIRRDGLPDTGLLPVLVNIQGVSGDYDFLHSVAREMAAQLALSQPLLRPDHPYPDFKDFLLGLAGPLQGRRFVLLLDEADLIPQRQLGDLLPGFLRALMQEPQYPTLLLFCGTHNLQRMGREYSSILFNTAQFHTVSYLSEAESAEVLTKPAGAALEFDPAVLAEAYRLTQGQPLLLQSLGATLIDQCNAVLLGNGQRSNYINLNDFNQAAETLVQRGNAAFEQHWDDCDAATHRLLATLAWATDEINRPQLDLAGIEASLAQQRMDLPAGAAFKIVERLSEEEILRRKGPTYHYAVPLYRRWVAWRWPPDRVREE